MCWLILGMETMCEHIYIHMHTFTHTRRFTRVAFACVTVSNFVNIHPVLWKQQSYKCFCENLATQIHMPCFTKNEILSFVSHPRLCNIYNNITLWLCNPAATVPKEKKKKEENFEVKYIKEKDTIMFVIQSESQN